MPPSTNSPITKLLWPLDVVFITQGFGANPATYKRFGLRGHDGLDLRTRWFTPLSTASPLGRRYVTACADGVIEEIIYDVNGYGIHIRQRLLDGSLLIYGHLTKPYVTPKSNVKAGARIALSGNTGFSSGPHLHIELRPKGSNPMNGYGGAVDPRPYFPAL